jgi:hypothetical protein
MAASKKDQEEREAQRKQREEREARERDRQKEVREARERRNADRRAKQVQDPVDGNTSLVPSTSLALLVGSRSLSYRQARRKVSAYIKYNRLLKHGHDRSCVTLDAKLALLLGGEPGTEVDIRKVARWVREEMTQDAFADARRRISEETAREHAKEVQGNAAHEQEKRLARADEECKARDEERRRAAEAHQRRVEEEYRRLKGG